MFVCLILSLLSCTIKKDVKRILLSNTGSNSNNKVTFYLFFMSGITIAKDVTSFMTLLLLPLTLMIEVHS